MIRHRLPTRLWHWTNALALVVMLGSGLMIFNAHPRLYWGEYGANADPAWLEIGATRSGEGVLRVGAVRLRTTGVLGISANPAGEAEARAFPRWATIPSHYSLADARLWHMAFAWVLAGGLLVYLPWAVAGARRNEAGYNRGQRIAYAAVRFVLLPVAILTGLAMAPGMDAAWPWLSGMFGGRQSARSVHFLMAAGLTAFAVGHLALWLASRPLDRLRGMVTGRRSHD